MIHKIRQMFDIDVWLRPDVQLLDVAGPLDVLSTATRLRRARGQSGGYRLHLRSSDGTPALTAAGVGLTADADFAGLSPDGDRTLLLPGRWTDPSDPPEPDLIRTLETWPGRIASVCTAAWRVAQAGRLDGRRATTHWLFADRMQRAFPTLEVDADALWVRDGPVWTSAGVSAGIDLALALVEADLGRATALEVARLLVLYMKRPGGQSQFSAALESQHAAGGNFDELLTWMYAHPGEDLRVDALAERVRMSPRHFARTFTQQLGVTPAKKVRLIRLEAARRLIEEAPDLNLHDVAVRTGHGTVESLRRQFLRALKLTPGAYRARFARPTGGDDAMTQA